MKTKTVNIGNLKIGGPDFVVMAGPCSLEANDNLLKTSIAVKEHGAQMLRGGIFKLRTSPNSFQGLGAEAFKLVKEAKEETGLPFISEVTDPRQIGDLYDVLDAFQVGSRNMHNYELLKELGKTDKPILLKRGFSGLVKEWLLASEYVHSNGNEDVILCERGIRTFEDCTRNTFDLNAIAFIKKNSEFPVIADPSHATGDRDLVTPLSLAAACAGADGLIVEVHPDPDNAMSDGFQTLNFDQFGNLMTQLEAVLGALSRKIHPVL